MITDEVLVALHKYDGSPHRSTTLRRLGADQHGVWLAEPPGSVTTKGADGIRYHHPEARVWLIPRDAWWTAHFVAAPAKLEIYCDIVTPPVWRHPGEVTMVDLDLDVVRNRSGRVALLDEDEFAEHRVRYGYPAEVIVRATEAARWLLAAVAGQVEPFATEYRRWLDLVAA